MVRIGLHDIPNLLGRTDKRVLRPPHKAEHLRRHRWPQPLASTPTIASTDPPASEPPASASRSPPSTSGTSSVSGTARHQVVPRLQIVVVRQKRRISRCPEHQAHDQRIPRAASASPSSATAIITSASGKDTGPIHIPFRTTSPQDRPQVPQRDARIRIRTEQVPVVRKIVAAHQEAEVHQPQRTCR